MSYNKASKAKSFNKNGKKKMPDQTKSTVLTLVIIAAVVVVAVGLIAFLLIMDGIKPYEITEEKTNYVCLSVAYTDKNGDEKTGDIVVELYPNKAPITTWRKELLCNLPNHFPAEATLTYSIIIIITNTREVIR